MAKKTRHRNVEETIEFWDEDDMLPSEDDPRAAEMALVPANTAAGESVQSGMVLGDYVILRKIGEGGGGTVYKAQHQRMERIVALKMLNSAMDNYAIARFHREVKAAAKLIHPHIVTAFDAGEHEGTPYLVLEHVDGRSLDDVIGEGGPVQVDTACDFVIQAARGLAYAHSQNIIHRDIKPSNLMLDSAGVIKILDMGLARSTAVSTESTDGSPESADGITNAGTIMGTVAFMSPEQGKDAKSVDHRADIYSLGCTFYYLLTGKPIYNGEMIEVLLAHAKEPIPSLRDERQDVTEELDELFQKIVAKDPDDRCQSMNELVADLEEFIDPGNALDEPLMKDGPGGSRIGSILEQAAMATVKSPSTIIDHAPSVGIDFGSSTSAIAFIDKEVGQPAILPNSEGDLTTPSVVMVDGSSISIGKKALDQVGTKGDAIADHIKRDLGEPVYRKTLADEEVPPEALVAVILNKLVTDARIQIGDFKHAVIAVPAYFGDAKRKAIQDAAKIAGLELLDLINEPTAIAASYCHERGLFEASEDEPPKKFLICDFGGGAFDVSLMEVHGKTIKVLATDGAPILGGHDWDDRLAKDVSRMFKAKYQIDPLDDRNAAALLRQECQTRRHELSEEDQVTIKFQYQDKPASVKISRQQLENFTSDIIKVMVVTIQRVLQGAKLDWSKIDKVFATGGLARMPMIRKMVVQMSGEEPEMWLNEDDAVAHGAALYAGAKLAKRKGEEPEFKVEEVNSHSMGVVVTQRGGKKVHAVVIPRNSHLPATGKRTFKTGAAGQTSLSIHIVQGESKNLSKCKSLGRCTIDDLPPDLPASSPITVEFRCATNGRLSVFFEQPESDQRINTEIQRKHQLDQDEIEHWKQWLESSMLYADLM